MWSRNWGSPGNLMQPRMDHVKPTRIAPFPHLFAATLIIGLAAEHARAAAIYTVTDLGASGNSGSYLNSLDPSDQAAFNKTSFGATTHSPAVSSWSFYNDDVPGGNPSLRPNFTSQASFTTGNNLGTDVGTAQVQWPMVSGNPTTTELVTMSYDPHVIQALSNHGVQVTAPGYLTIMTGMGIGMGTPVAINDNGLIVENLNMPGSFGTYAYFPKDGLKSIGDLGVAKSAAVAMNDAGQVVGWSTTSGGAAHAFFYSNGLMQDLNGLISQGSGFVLTNGLGIDDAGQIVAQGVDASGVNHFLLLNPFPLPSPVPEPGTLSILGIGSVCLILRRARSRSRRTNVGR